MQVNTSKKTELIDITEMVSSEVESAGIGDGMCVIRTAHTTTSILINENEAGLVSDIIGMLERIVPSNAGYNHDRIDNNADSHLRSILLFLLNLMGQESAMWM
ncbi:secondary thiamine-phosphate synthase enzyme [Methanohalophilus levihalophilus]|uniref:secondary thiamine-phosphate synthase enzyme YjbQ n=1 Tax=Methanohalophilus levihalophilus TaxID=1431282 RepID=UPI001FD8B213|nr:secondary thiamine-phosphate synthase enzyme YjbQ [Methanohalophilus levihalophilus]MBP2030546.1 secondary thiamine-phosphate synthase enzyme [Methanohalophilus levihalophilus]